MFPIIIKTYSPIQLMILINLIRFNNINKFKIKITKQIKPFLLLLQYLSLISVYKIKNTIYYNLYLNNINFNYNFKKIKIISTYSKNYYINYKNLLLLTKRLNTTILIINTSFGLITHIQALQLQIGGILICYILN